MNRLLKFAALLASVAALVALAVTIPETRFLLLLTAPLTIPIVCEMGCELLEGVKG